MESICSQFSIDTVITHTAPSFCELFTKESLHHWIQNDDILLDDVKVERTTMDKLHERLVRDHHPVCLNEWNRQLCNKKKYKCAQLAAIKARKLGNAILTEAMNRDGRVSLKSYECASKCKRKAITSYSNY